MREFENLFVFFLFLFQFKRSVVFIFIFIFILHPPHISPFSIEEGADGRTEGQNRQMAIDREGGREGNFCGHITVRSYDRWQEPGRQASRQADGNRLE